MRSTYYYYIPTLSTITKKWTRKNVDVDFYSTIINTAFHIVNEFNEAESIQRIKVQLEIFLTFLSSLVKNIKKFPKKKWNPQKRLLLFLSKFCVHIKILFILNFPFNQSILSCCCFIEGNSLCWTDFFPS